MKVAILGSCVSRDAFGHHEDLLGRPVRYFARSALASAMCPTPFRGVDTSGIASPFQRTIVGLDLDKAFQPWLAEGDFDLLVVDSIEERFALLVDEAGAVATRSSEFVAAGHDTSGCRTVAPHTDEAWAMWEDAWVRFIAAVDAVGARDRVRVNRVRWATTFDGPGAEFTSYHSPQRIHRTNRFLRRIYQRMELDLSPLQFFRYGDDELRAATEHQWGPAPFHYTPAFYRRFVEHVTGEPLPGTRTGWRGRLAALRGR